MDNGPFVDVLSWWFDLPIKKRRFHIAIKKKKKQIVILFAKRCAYFWGCSCEYYGDLYHGYHHGIARIKLGYEGFHKWVYPCSSIYRWIFPEINHPAIKGMTMETPICVRQHPQVEFHSTTYWLTARLPVFQWPQTSKVKKKMKVWSEMDELSKKNWYTNV